MGQQAQAAGNELVAMAPLKDWEPEVVRGRSGEVLTVPEGWEYLPAEPGLVRKVRINQDWMSFSSDKPVLLEQRHQTFKIADAKLLGDIQICTAEGKDSIGCGYRRAWLETDGPLLILR